MIESGERGERVPGRKLSEVARFLRTEQVGGLILLAATALAMVAANTPLRGSYHRLASLELGPLAVEQWATDGLLSVFFVVAGLELKRELVVGSLRRPRRAMLPVFGAIGGMVVPAAVCLAVSGGDPKAWAVPVATDIAFALAVLAITARELPPSLRVFLLSLAIVDDLGAILLIAIVFTAHIAVLPLLGAAASIAAFAVLQQRRVRPWWPYVVLGVTAWALVHESGVHATVAGVAIGLATRVRRDPGERVTPAMAAEHRLQPWSAGVCVPLFAFFAAGVPLSTGGILRDRVALAVVAGLLVGKTAGVLGGAALAVRLRLARLPRDLHWRDLAAVSVLTGCGFTVSLLITGLAFDDAAEQDRITIAVLLASLVASVTGALLLRRRVKAHGV